MKHCSPEVVERRHVVQEPLGREPSFNDSDGGRLVIVDDKIRLLAAIKQVWAARCTTVFVRQGHYAADTAAVAAYPAADVTVDRIGDVSTHAFP